MADQIARQSALEGLLKPETSGAGDGTRIEELADVTQRQIFARNGQSDALAKAVAGFLKQKKPLGPLQGAERGGVFVCAVGPREYWVAAQGRSAAKAVQELEKAVDALASVFDQSDGRFVIRLSGPGADGVLACGTSLDLQDPTLPAKWGTHTQIEHIPALVLRRASNGTAVFDVSVPRSYAGSFVAWLR